MSPQEMTSTNNFQTYSTSHAQGQYTLWQILGIWLLATIPMGILSWIVFPALSPDFSSDPLAAGVTRIVLLTVGLIWLFVLSMIIVWKEEGDLGWATIKRRLRLNAPQDPITGMTHRRLWMWVIPFIAGNVAWGVAITPYAEKLWVSIFPFLAEPPGYSSAVIFESQEILQRLVGAWWFFGLFVVSSVFNILGEEFLLRGVLLPKMEGVFGRWSWVANGALSAFYHVHQPWTIAGNVIQGVFVLAFPSWRFRSTWMGVFIHSVENVVGGFLILGIILGLA
ncbi:MAG TPA: CPBP family intramembrane glutamic endopeptidase [Anaerolineales bacterium]|nr:CPBP family intramembrane glutamic endopeptidase [Anaerolineales bacterium]